MRTVSVRVEDLKKIVIPIGFVGENLHTKVIIDSTKVFADYPDAIATMTVQPAAGAAYPAVVVRNGNAVEWDVSDSDLVNVGRGEIQLSFTVDEVIAKSYIGTVRVERSILPAGEVPEPIDDWMNRAETALSEIDGLTASAETLAAGSSATAEIAIVEGHKNIALGIPKGDKGDPGTPGVDGFSPSASVSKSGTKATISITDKNGTTTAEVSDGTDGTPGQDGYSPTATVTKSGSVATISITDKNGTTTAQISDGQDGDTGATPVISIGTVSTLTPGSDATASMDTTDPEHPVLSLGIPEGEPGEVTEAELFDATHDRWNEEGEPYLFRSSGGDASVYEWERDTLVGGTVAWNQRFGADEFFALTGLTITKPSTGVYRLNGTLESATSSNTPVTLTNGHVYLIDSNRPNADTVVLSNTQNWQTNATKYIIKATDTRYVNVYAKAGTYTDVDMIPQVFDLTQMFGSTIADYIYTLESGTSGAGIAWLKSHGFMTKPYYAYDAGTLQSVQASKHITRGFNQLNLNRTAGTLTGSSNTTQRTFDEGKYYAGLSADNWYSDVVPTNVSVSENSVSFTSGTNIAYGVAFPVRCFPNTTYYVKATETNGFVSIGYFTVDGTYISYTGGTNDMNGTTFTTPSNAGWIVVALRSDTANANVTFSEVVLNLHWDGERDGQYEPYTSHTYALGSDELRGVFMLDSNNKLYCNGDTKTSDGTINRRYVLVDLGTLNWSYVSASGHERMIASLSGLKFLTENLICPKYQADTVAHVYSHNIDKSIASHDTYHQLWVYDSAYDDENTFKTAMSGVYLLYELATPTTESADPFTNPQAVSPYGTEEYTDSRAVPIPVGHETKYLMNPYQYVEELTKPTEDDMVANNNITSGSYFIIGNRLLKASSAIASGSAIIPGSNCVETNLAEALNTLQ